MITRHDPAKRTYRYAFSSLAELQRYIADTPRKWRTDTSVSGERSKSWDLNAGYVGAMTLARDGWLEGAKRAQEALKLLETKTPAYETVNDVAGYRPNVPRYCAGAFDCMVNKRDDPRAGFGRVLTLYVSLNANGHVGAEYIANFGIGVAQYVNQLEAEGVRVELHGITGSVLHGRDRVAYTWKVKGADQPLDLAVLAFSIGHPAMLRRLGFALDERSDVACDSNYGRALPAVLSDIIEPPLGAYILNGSEQADRIARTPADALAFISKALDALVAAGD